MYHVCGFDLILALNLGTFGGKNIKIIGMDKDGRQRNQQFPYSTPLNPTIL